MDKSNPQNFIIEIKTMTFGGDGMGRLPDGRAVFTPFVLPGEKVEVQIVEDRKSHARASLIKVIESSPDRITPRCPHFTVCGGCHYQHLPYEKQLDLKMSILKEQFQRIAGVVDLPMEPIAPSIPHWNYRNSLQFHLNPEGKPGFQQSNSHRVVAIKECHLPEAGINDLWPRLEFDALTNIEKVILRNGTDEDEMVILESTSAEMPEFEMDMPISVVHLTGENQVVLAGDDYLMMQVKDKEFKVSAGSFFQVNTSQAQVIVEYILNNLSLSQEDFLLDMYCGVGLFSAFLAEKVGNLAGIEMSESACEDFAFNLDSYDNVSLYQGPAEIVLPALDLKPTVILMDPPRSGIEPATMDAVLKTEAGRIVYISCDPATLARDAKKLLAGGYRIERVKPVDMFPQTYHIESVTFFQRVL